MVQKALTRKLTTILAADVVGYSRLMAADEEGTLRTLNAYRKIIDSLIDKHYGRLVGTAGDAVLVEFGSAVEAVRCAISIQEELAVRNAQRPEEQRMLWRIGINVGDVIIENDDLFGDGVNVAARLEGLANPGGICISGSAFEQVKNKVSLAFEDIGPQAVKNIPQPVSTFRVIPGPVSIVSEGRLEEQAGTVKSRSRRKPVLVMSIVGGMVIGVVGYAGFYLWAERASPTVPNPKNQAGGLETAKVAPVRPPPPPQGPAGEVAVAKTAPSTRLPKIVSTAQMSATEIEAMMAGINIRGRTRIGERPFVIKLNKGGKAIVDVVRPSGDHFRETGTWWTSNHQFCMKFSKFGQGRTMCPQFNGEYNRMMASRPNGAPLDWAISR